MKRLLILLVVIASMLVFAVPATSHDGAQYVTGAYVEDYLIRHRGGWANCRGEVGGSHGWIRYAPGYITRYQMFWCDSSWGGERWHTRSDWSLVKDWSVWT